jgi:DNA repair photolyase
MKSRLSKTAGSSIPETPSSPSASIQGRGTIGNPANRFEKIFYEPDLESIEPEGSSPATEFFKDSSRSFITYNDSPDVGFEASINPYRGCEHGCIYCYARPNHEYLGFSAGLDFETKILIKEDAPDLLRRELASPKWKPQVIAMSGVTDPYQPAERRLCLTRRCLEVLAEFRNPVAIVTKNHLVARDVDLLGDLAQYEAAVVFLSITTLNGSLAQKLEPRASHPDHKLTAIEHLAQAGIPVGVMVAPVIPGLTDHEMPAILKAASEAGARHAGYILVRLPYGVSQLFEQWLTRHFPDRKNKILNRIRSIRDGKLNDPHFKSRMSGKGIFAGQVAALFTLSCQKAGIAGRSPRLSAAAFRRPQQPQLSLFK